MHSFRVAVETDLAEEFRKHAKAKGFSWAENLLRQLLCDELGRPAPKPMPNPGVRVTASSALILKTIEGNGPSTVAQLIQATSLPFGTTHGLVRRLCQDGFIHVTEVKTATGARGAPPRVYGLTDLGRLEYAAHRDGAVIQNRHNIYESEVHAEARHAGLLADHNLDAILQREMDEVSAVRAKFRNIKVDAENFRGRTEGRLFELAAFNHGKAAAPALSKEWIAQAEYEVLSGQTTYEALFKGATDRLNDALWEVEEPRRFAEMQRGADASYQAELAYQAELVEQEARAEHSARAEAEQP